MMRAVPLRRAACSARRAGPGRCGAKRACCALQFQAARGLFIFCCSTAQRKVTTTNMPLPSEEGSARAAPQFPGCANGRAEAPVAEPGTPSGARQRKKAVAPGGAASCGLPPAPSVFFRHTLVFLPQHYGIRPAVIKKISSAPSAGQKKNAPCGARPLCARRPAIRRCGAKGAGGKHFPPAEPGAGPEVPTCDRSSPGWCGASARRERIRRR